jgi:hypothetical protein
LCAADNTRSHLYHNLAIDRKLVNNVRYQQMSIVLDGRVIRTRRTDARPREQHELAQARALFAFGVTKMCVRTRSGPHTPGITVVYVQRRILDKQ